MIVEFIACILIAFTAGWIISRIVATEKNNKRDQFMRRHYTQSHGELLAIHKIGLSYAECPPRTPEDTWTVGMVKDMAHRLIAMEEEYFSKDALAHSIQLLEKQVEDNTIDAQAMRSLRACIRSDIDDFVERTDFNQDLMLYIGRLREK